MVITNQSQLKQVLAKLVSGLQTQHLATIPINQLLHDAGTSV